MNNQQNCQLLQSKNMYIGAKVDLASAPIKDGCFAWLASACSMEAFLQAIYLLGNFYMQEVQMA